MILSYIQTNGSGQITGLAEWLGVSEATIRRDLDELDDKGRLERTRGGALSNRAGTSFEHRQEEKLSLMQAEKRRIAHCAAGFIRPGDTVFLDSGTTTYFLSLLLSAIPNLTVISYDLVIAHTAELHATSQMIVTGGIRRQGYNNVLVGSQVEDFLHNVRIDKVFLGADAVDLDFGVSNSNFHEAGIKRLAKNSGTEKFLLVDHSKFDTVALAKVCPLNDIDTLITDSGADPVYLQKLSKLVGRLSAV